MDLKEFYKTVEDIVLYPGTVDELNKRKDVTVSGKRYEEIPLHGGKKFITGVIIPSPSEFQELTNVMQDAAEALGGMGLDVDDADVNKLTEMLEPTMKKLYGIPAVMNMDLRLKVKEIGANGLVCVQLYNKEDRYMGIPVSVVE